MASVKITGEFQTWDYDKYMENDGSIRKNNYGSKQDVSALRGWI
jgi:hypothetical protein